MALSLVLVALILQAPVAGAKADADEAALRQLEATVRRS
jgi:hypothetical protein